MNSDDKFKDIRSHELDVLLLLKNVIIGKAAGPDGIHGMVLNNCAASLAKLLTFLLNISFVTCCIPDKWKMVSFLYIKKMTKVQ